MSLHLRHAEAMQIRLRRHLRLTLPLASTCAGAAGDHTVYAVACPRTGLLARRAKIVEHAWVRVARDTLYRAWPRMTAADST